MGFKHIDDFKETFGLTENVISQKWMDDALDFAFFD
jgi:hypothetical protein